MNTNKRVIGISKGKICYADSDITPEAYFVKSSDAELLVGFIDEIQAVVDETAGKNLSDAEMLKMAADRISQRGKL